MKSDHLWNKIGFINPLNEREIRIKTAIKKILELTGFYKVKHKIFLESELNDYSEPLHVLDMPPVWNALNKEFYESNNLKHYYDSKQGKYVINFKLTGFDSCPEHSLTVEAKKLETIDQNKYFYI